MTVHQPRRLLLAALTSAVALAACGGGDAPAASPSDYPPTAYADLEAAIAPLVEEHGVRLTRAALIDTSAGGYEPSATGRHLALYVEPVDVDYSTDDFIDGLVDLTVATAPVVFERWPAIETYDICQEPRPGEDDRAEPIPVTQVVMDREHVEATDWDALDLTELIRMARAGGDDVNVFATEELAADPRYQAASAEAGSPSPSEP